MGLLQDETFSDALKLALAARMISQMPYAVPVQMPIIAFPPPAYYDLMNPTTTKPFMTFNPFTSNPGLAKTLRPSYIAIPNYTIVPFHPLKPQAPPPQWTPSPHLPDSAFWDLVKQTAEYSARGAAGLAWLFSEFAKPSPEKEPTFAQDDRRLGSCDSFYLDSSLSMSMEDDLLRLDLAELESIPSSELYLREAEPVASAAASVPELVSAQIKTLSSPSLSPSNTSLDTLPEGSLPDEDLSMLVHISDGELYFDVKALSKLGATPPWPFNSPAFVAPTPMLTWARRLTCPPGL